MTVEQSSLQQHNTKKSREEKLIQTYAKVKEITRIEDQRVIDEAISACKKKDGSYEVEDVVSMLVQDDSLRRQIRSKNSKSVSFREEQRQEQGQTQSKDSMPKVPVQETAPPRKNNVIDLTQEAGEQQELSKAISASLQDAQGILGGQVTREEQDISRILEASLAESKAGTKRKRGELWFVDPLNPHERKRQGTWPVGLKNIGNTCWFSAVIQSLFYLPKFRRLVLNFKTPYTASSNLQAVQERRNLRFMRELSLLFGLMVGSTRKYVDPSKAVDILKEAFSSPSGITDSQQDVSEFQHKLLEWLEDAFKWDQSQPRPSPPASPADGTAVEGGGGSPTESLVTNPVTELFYGQFRAEGEHEGEKFSKQETFGQFPLQVNGFCDIHESLEATTMQDEIEAVNKDCTAHKSGQELWFTRLPPVLTFELCRFQFNQQLGRPEKIHNKLEFPSVIYVDRYLENNKTLTRRRREESRKLKEQLTTVQARLDRFMNYGSGSKRCPLHDVLQYTLEFAQSRSSSSSSSSSCSSFPPSSPTSFLLPSSLGSPAPTTSSLSDVEMESPKTSLNSDARGSDSPSATASVNLSAQASSEISTASSITSHSSSSSSSTTAAATTTVVELLSAPLTGPPHPHPHNHLCSREAGGDSVGAPPPTPGLCPTPKQVSDSELHVLQGCLRRWRQEVESDVRELQSTISSLETKLDKMYSDESMQKFPYHLHAVLVHEGQAASGHYWAFVYDHARACWLKFNDVTVSESSWEELERESVGGYHNASAYCLMYVDRSRIQDFPERGEASASSSVSQILEWMEMLPQQLQEEVARDNKALDQEMEDWDTEQARKPVSDPEVTVTYQQKPSVGGGSPQVGQMSQTSLPNCHAQLSFPDTVRAVEQVAKFLESAPPASVLTQATATELKRLQEMAGSAEGRLPQEDLRLRHMVVYLLCNSASNTTLHIVLLEQFAFLTLLDHTPRKKQLRLSSWEKISQIRKNIDPASSASEDYEDWHRRYHQFRQAVHMFVHGLQAYYKGRYTEALPYFNQSWLHNRSARRGKSSLAGLDNRLISFFRRNCLQHVNGEAMQQFEADSDVSEALTLMRNQILPSLAFLSQSGVDSDTATLEELRGKWCAFLEKELSDAKIEELRNFLTEMFENFADVKLEKAQSVKLSEMTNLFAQHSAIMNTAGDAGDIQRALAVR
ncbi:hypothetical protein ACOMHN_050693 [Nucella lapillus]